MMNSKSKMALLAAVAAAVLVSPVSVEAKNSRHHGGGAVQTYRLPRAPAGRIYLLEDRGANANAAVNFQDAFRIDY